MIVLGIFIYQIFRQTMMTVTVTVVANSVYDEDMGTVNGIGQSFVALTRAAGPMFISPLLSWSFSQTSMTLIYISILHF